MVFKNNLFLKGRAPWALMIFDNTWKTWFLRALGVPGALQERPAGFFSAWGGPLGAAKACSLAKFEGNTCVFCDSAFRLNRFWRPPRERWHFMFGAKEGPGTPSEKLNSDLGAPKGKKTPQTGTLWFEQVHQTLRLCRFQRFRRISGLFFVRGKLHQTLRLCRFQRFANQRKSSPGKPQGLSIRLSKD